MKELNKPYWSIELDVIIKNFDVDPARGLSDEEVKKRQKEYGLNQLSEAPNVEEILKHERTNSLVFLILDLIIFLVVFIPTAMISGIISILGDNGLTLTIISLVSLVIVNLYEIYLIFKIINTMKPWVNGKMEEEKAKFPKITVIREGKEQKIFNNELVPGDIIIFDTSVNYAYLYEDQFSYLIEQGLPLPFIGEPFAGDARLLESNELETNEASLTGEPEPSKKDASIAVLHESSKLYEVVNMVFAHTRIVKGNGKAVVVATGKNTETGKISVPIDEGPTYLELAKIRWGPTPAEKYRNQLKLLSGLLSIFFFIILILSWLF